jgi:hypothetical protein
MSKARARPVYTPELADEICRRLLEGNTLKVICRDEGMPAESTVRLWALDDVEGFAARYARARMVGYQTMADDIIEISDNPETDPAAVNRDRLKVDTRKWLLAKALPKVYGDKVTAEVTGKDGGPLKVERTPFEIAQRLAFLLTAGAEDLDQRKKSNTSH